MHAFRSIAISLLLTGCALLAVGQGNPVLIGSVTRIVDGDTIKIQLTSGQITVRLDSIDTPERDQPWGREATEALAGLIDGDEVALEVVSQDRYGRLVAVVYLGNENINAWMVKQGHAWAYRQYLKDKNYCEWENSARTDARGLWVLPANSRHAPWEWRAEKRGQTSGYTDFSQETTASCIAAIGQSAPATQVATTALTGSAAVPHSGSCDIKGNISKNGRIYHVPGSAYYDITVISESKGERWFCSVEEAEAAGWRAPRQLDGSDATVRSERP